MELITPGLGLIFWMTISFGLVLFVLRKFAWTPILSVIKERESIISEGIRKEKQLEKEIKKVKETREQILQQANEEALMMVKSARDEAEQIIKKSQEHAKLEAEMYVENSKRQIIAERKAVESKIRQEIVHLSVDLAQSLLKEEFADADKKNKYVSKLLDNIQLS